MIPRAFLALAICVNLYISAFAEKNSTEPYVVLITGCSSGIGRASALRFANNSKFRVYATMRDTRKWTEPSLNNLFLMNMDVTSDVSVRSAVKSIEDKEGKIDIVVNNAGYGIAGSLESVSVQEAQSVFDVNVWGVVRVLQEVLPAMRKAKRGHVINISSTSGIRGIPCFEMYTGSKFALEGITDSLRYTLAPYGVSVTNLNAGPVRTSFTERFGNIEMGGKGTREADDSLGFLSSMTEKMIGSLNRRMESAEAQV